MKASKQCPKCSSLKVGSLETVPDYSHGSAVSPAVAGLSAPSDFWGIQKGFGLLEAYVCAECGFFETYVKDPATVPFEQIVGFRWLNETPDSKMPYR